MIEQARTFQPSRDVGTMILRLYITPVERADEDGRRGTQSNQS